VICTLGPACWSVEGLQGLIDAGMNIARFNFSHGDHKTHFATLQRLREAVATRPGAHIGVMLGKSTNSGILLIQLSNECCFFFFFNFLFPLFIYLDTKGPEIRTGKVDPALGGKVKFEKGDIVEVGTDYTRPCTREYLACSYKSLPLSVKVGGRILVADGQLTFKVLELRENSVIAEAMNNAAFGDHKNMNLPGCIVDLPTLTEKDIDDLQNFGIVHQVDFIAASFVRCGQDIDNIRSVLGEAGHNIKIIAKIENQQGLENFEEILQKTDGIMVARGDLGMEIPIEKVFIAQKMMIHQSNIAGKPVVTATQMLESMITNPRPTRAECADVANAVLDGTDCVMLSGETANGEFPNDAVRMMASTCVEAESLIDYDAQYDSIRYKILASQKSIPPSESIASSAVKTARDLGAKLIIVLTETGNTARLIAKYRPQQPIIAMTSHADIARQMQGYFKNTVAKLVPSMEGTEALIALAIQDAKLNNLVNDGDQVVVVHGNREAISGSTNMLRVISA
jgi:pyruvate kinase